MGNAFKGILIGLVLVLAGVALLWWNEGRAVLTAQGLTEGAGLVISVAADHLDPANEGRLAHTSGRALTGGSLTDPDFPYMTVKALALQRSVAVRDYLATQKLPSERMFLGAVKMVPSDAKWSPRAELNLTIP